MSRHTSGSAFHKSKTLNDKYVRIPFSLHRYFFSVMFIQVCKQKNIPVLRSFKGFAQKLCTQFRLILVVNQNHGGLIGSTSVLAFM